MPDSKAISAAHEQFQDGAITVLEFLSPVLQFALTQQYENTDVLTHIVAMAAAWQKAKDAEFKGKTLRQHLEQQDEISGDDPTGKLVNALVRTVMFDVLDCELETVSGRVLRNLELQANHRGKVLTSEDADGYLYVPAREGGMTAEVMFSFRGVIIASWERDGKRGRVQFQGQ